MAEYYATEKDPMGRGLSVYELHHLHEGRELYGETIELIWKFLGVPAEYDMWFNDNGSGYNFSSMGFNLTKGRDSVVNMLDNGYWSQRWGNHMEKTNKVNWVNPKIENKNCNELPDPSTWNIHPEAEAFLYVDNETGNGFHMQFPFKGY